MAKVPRPGPENGGGGGGGLPRPHGVDHERAFGTGQRAWNAGASPPTTCPHPSKLGSAPSGGSTPAPPNNLRRSGVGFRRIACVFRPGRVLAVTRGLEGPREEARRPHTRGFQAPAACRPAVGRVGGRGDAIVAGPAARESARDARWARPAIIAFRPRRCGGPHRVRARKPRDGAACFDVPGHARRCGGSVRGPPADRRCESAQPDRCRANDPPVRGPMRRVRRGGSRSAVGRWALAVLRQLSGVETIVDRPGGLARGTHAAVIGPRPTAAPVACRPRNRAAVSPPNRSQARFCPGLGSLAISVGARSASPALGREAGPSNGNREYGPPPNAGRPPSPAGTVGSPIARGRCNTASSPFCSR